MTISSGGVITMTSPTPPPQVVSSSSSSSQHHSGSSSGTTTIPSVAPPPPSDEAYCSEIARRSVARAALHLGIECMTGDTLDALGDALLTFLERFGRSVSHAAEVSQRSSSHCNVLDALRAAESCTAPAAYQVTLGSPEDDEATAAAAAGTGPGASTAAAAGGGGAGGSSFAASMNRDRSWEGLASFLFGPDWLQIPVPDGNNDDDQGVVAGGQQNGVMGHEQNGVRGGPSRPGGSNMANGGVGHTRNNQEDEQHRFAGGWNAPYIGQVSPFPVCASNVNSRGGKKKKLRNNQPSIANPHKLPRRIALSLHGLAPAEDACRGVDAKGNYRPHSHAKADLELEEAREKAVEAARLASDMVRKVPDDVFAGGPPSSSSLWGVSGIGNGGANGDEGGKASSDGAGSGAGGSSKTADDKMDETVAGGKDKKGSKGSADGKDSKDKNSPSSKSKKRARFDDSTKDDENGAKNKKAKTSDGDTKDTFISPLDESDEEESGTGAKNRSRNHTPPYVPPFLPSFPPEKTYFRGGRLSFASSSQSGCLDSNKSPAKSGTQASTAVTSAMDDDEQHEGLRSVRKSLVQLGRTVGTSFWGKISYDESGGGGVAGDADIISQGQPSGGSGSVGDDDDDDASSPSGKEGGDASSASAVPPSAQAARTAAAPVADSPTVVPLGRASGSRVSRILEGSMDAAL